MRFVRTNMVCALLIGSAVVLNSDRSRDAWLEEQGFRVLRFWNDEVLTNLLAVLERIAEILAPSPWPSPPSTLLRAGSRGEGMIVPKGVRGMALRCFYLKAGPLDGIA